MNYTAQRECSKLKIRFPAVIISLLLILSFPLAAFADEDAISSIDVSVLLRQDGSAVITENWTVDNAYSGTEFFKPISDKDGISVHSLKVREGDKVYQTLSEWDVDKSLEEKAQSCGILKTDDGYELCWGMGSYGDHIYTIEYTMEGLVKNYGEFAGFYYQLINDMPTQRHSFSAEVSLESVSLNADNARIWGYGYEGWVDIDNQGFLTAKSEGDLSESSSLKLLCRFDPSLFPQAASANMSFEELQKIADGDNSSLPLLIFAGVTSGLIAAGIAFFSLFMYRFKLSDGSVARLKSNKKLADNMTPPFMGSLSASFACLLLLRQSFESNNLLNAYLILLQSNGAIKLEGGEKSKNVKILFDFSNRPADGLEQKLFDILADYADSSGVLDPKHLGKRTEAMHKRIESWHSQVKDQGSAELERLYVVQTVKPGKQRFTPTGFEQAEAMLGFKKYLKSFKDADNSFEAPRELWGDYLLFSALFGLEKNTLKGMQNIDEDFFSSFSRGYGYSPMAMIYFMNMSNNLSNSVSGENDGTGGSTSGMGGGGFSSGGGSR